MFQRFKKKNDFWPSFRLSDWAVLACGVTVFVGLAASTVTKFSIWFDEAFGSYLIRFDIVSLTRYTAFDVHPPFYYWLLKAWSIPFGNTELGIRSMSIFFGVVTLVGAFALVHKLFGRRAAWISLIFLVLSPLFIRYSQEARMYTLLTAIVVAATYVLVYAQRSKQRWAWMLYGVLLAIGMLTQYFAALAWLAHWVWRTIVVRNESGAFKQKFFTRDWVVAHTVAIAIFLPWLPWLVRQFADVQGNGFWIPPITSATIPDFFTNFLLFTDHDGAKSWLAAGFYIILVMTIILVVVLLTNLKAQQRENYLLVVCMVIAPVVLLVIMSLPPLRPAFIDRYLMATIVFLPILIGSSVALAGKIIHRKILIGFSVIVVAMMIVGIGTQMSLGNYNKSTRQSNDVREIVEQVRSKNPANTPIVANTPWIFYEAAIYSDNESPIYFVNETTKYEFGSLRMLSENDENKIVDLDAFSKKYPSFWVISNLRDSTPNKIRDSWVIHESITINDDVSHAPLFRAIHVSAE